MSLEKSFVTGIPGSLDMSSVQGKLIVVEGTDGVGRSTQIETLKAWLELNGHAVMTTGLTRSALMGKVISEAKSGHRLNPHTYSLLYLADFADRLEEQIIPALKSGFIVIADRYIYTTFARAVVRGIPKEWIRQAYAFAPAPHLVFYLKISIENLIPRVINEHTLHERYLEYGTGEGMDYWESGMDMRFGDDFYESFIEYQRKILEEFENMSQEFNFTVVDASKSFDATNRFLKEQIESLISQAPLT